MVRLLQLLQRLSRWNDSICKSFSKNADINCVTSSIQTNPHYSMCKFTFISISNSLLTILTSMPPDRGLSDKQHSGMKGNKARLTYLFMANADGSMKLPPLVIGKAQKPHAFKSKTGSQLGFYYRNNAKGWMTASIYQEWLLDWDQKL